MPKKRTPSRRRPPNLGVVPSGEDVGNLVPTAATTLEELVTSHHYFGLETATPVQRAVCRAIDGLPLGELWKDRDVRAAFGNAKPPSGLGRVLAPLELLLLAGIRSAKSLIAAATAFRAVQCVDVSRLRPGEIARISTISVDKDKARVIFNHLVGTVQAKPALCLALADEPTEDTILLRQLDTGAIIEVLVTAGRRAGSSLVGRWMAGVYFDEAARMVGADDGVVNLEDSRRAVLGRMLPGAQVLYLSSPWAPYGPVYQMTEEYFGRPTQQLVVIRAPGPVMNPVHWTKAAIEKLKKQDPIAYKTDVLGEFADAEYTVFSIDDLEELTLDEDEIKPQPGFNYIATMDPATRSNAWTLTITTCNGWEQIPGLGMDKTYTCVLAKQWVPGLERVSPASVLTEIADTIAPYGLDTVYTDQYSVDALSDIAALLPNDHEGNPRVLTLYEETDNPASKYDGTKTLQVLVQEHRFRFVKNPVMRSDLVRTKKRVTQDGLKFVLPKTSDGRHGDFVPALSKACLYLPEPPTPPAAMRDEMLDQARMRITRGTQDHQQRAIARLTGTRVVD